jgi:biotin transporter BioY
MYKNNENDGNDNKGNKDKNLSTSTIITIIAASIIVLCGIGWVYNKWNLKNKKIAYKRERMPFTLY